MQLFASYDNSMVRVFFYASTSLLIQTAYFLPLATLAGFEPAIIVFSNRYQNRSSAVHIWNTGISSGRPRYIPQFNPHIWDMNTK